MAGSFPADDHWVSGWSVVWSGYAGRMGMVPLQRVVAVDWSGDRSAAGQRKKIWAGVWTMRATGRVTLEGGRTRAELAEWLVEMARETPRMVVGIDFCFSFPAWFVREHGCGTCAGVLEDCGGAWRAVAASGVRGCAVLGREGPARTGKRPAEFCGEGLRRMMRTADMGEQDCGRRSRDAERAAKMKGITAKSPFQIGGSGSVGTGRLRAMPVLLRLREAGFRVWPFEAARGLKEARPLVVEMYTRLLTGPVAKSNAVARGAYLLRKRKEDAAYAGLSRGVVAKACGSEDAFDALVCAWRWRSGGRSLRGCRSRRTAVIAAGDGSGGSGVQRRVKGRNER